MNSRGHFIIKLCACNKRYHEDLDLSNVHELNDDEIERHINNITSAIVCNRSEHISLTHKLEMLQHRLEIRKNG